MKSLLFTLFIFISVITNAQHRKDNWYFGHFGAVNFSSGSPVSVIGSPMNASEGNATISDTSGNLLFYTDGRSVWNASNSVMPNGSGIASDDITCQGALIVPMPGSDSLYYLFTTYSWEFSVTDLRYSVIDMSLNGGLGDVTALKNVLVNDNVREQLTAVSDANETGFWIMVHEGLNHHFDAYHLTAAGLDVVPVVSDLGMDYTGINRFGSMHFSHDCTRLVSALGSLTPVNETVQVYDFNSSTGIVTNPVTVATYDSIREAYSSEFSPDGSKLYITTFTHAAVYQFDMNAVNIASTQIEITNDASSIKCGLALANDGKIYVGQPNSGNLCSIDAPNAAGLSCNFHFSAVSLAPGNYCAFGLPNNIDFTCQSPLSVSTSISPHVSFQISPNPAKDKFNITFDLDVKNALLEIYNCMEEKVYQEKLNSIPKTINCKMFYPGIYFVKVYIGEKIYCKKLIVEHD